MSELYDLYVIRGRFHVETKVLSKQSIPQLKNEFLACALEGDVEIRKDGKTISFEKIAQAFSVPEYEFRDYLYISKEWLKLNFFLTHGKNLYE